MLIETDNHKNRAVVAGSPTPVLDAMESVAGTEWDAVSGSETEAILKRVRGLPIFSVGDHYGFIGRRANAAYPDPSRPLHFKSAWVELLAPLARPYRSDRIASDGNFRIGILFEETEIEGWPYDIVAAKFALLSQGNVVSIHGRLLISAGEYFRPELVGRDAGDLTKLENYALPDFERVRYGIEAACDASEADLLRMSGLIVRCGKLLVHGCGTAEQTVYERLPRYGAAAEFGFAGLRAALSCVAFEDPDTSAFPSSSLPRRLFDHLILSGPLVALNALSAISRSLSKPYGSSIEIPEPFARGGKALFLHDEVDKPNQAAWRMAARVYETRSRSLTA